MTPFVDLTEREREIAHANYAAFKRRLERERVDERRERAHDRQAFVGIPPATTEAV